MKKMIVGWLCLVIVCTMAAARPARAAGRAAEVKAMKDRLVELEATVKDRAAEVDSRRTKILESADLVELRAVVDTVAKEYAEARSAYQTRLKELNDADPDLGAAISEHTAAEAEIEELQVKILKATTDTILEAGSSWKYLDDGSDPGGEWSAAKYDDAAWKAGAAPLGYGDRDEATVVESGPADAKHATTYFRTTFEVKDLSALDGLLLKLVRDDGAIVYINGQEVVRDNMPEGDITYQTFAAASVGGADEKTFHTHEIGKDSLVKGENVLAVEVHQTSPASSDISFDLELLGKLAASAWR